jgi:hypothetical protein
MLKKLYFSIFLLSGLFLAVTCIDPYYPKLGGYRSMLVAEGQLTNDNASYSVRLSMSKQENDSILVPVEGATVSVSDDEGTVNSLPEYSPGIYKSDSLAFRGEVGKIYQLHIITPDGKEYRSDSCTMYQVPGIDSVWYEKDEKFTKNQTVDRKGISIYLNTTAGPSDDYYLRWDYDETWKFEVPYPQGNEYFKMDSIPALPATSIHRFCYKSNKSSSISAAEVLSRFSDRALKVPLEFISTEESDRLSIRYSVNIHQYSLSYAEYKFWDNLKKVTETEGDIFGSQPFSVLSNIHNIADPGEPVLGYFRVSAVVHRRIFINFEELLPLDLPLYHHKCPRLVKDPKEYQGPWSPPFTFDDLYRLFMTTPGYAFVEPVYDGSGKLFRLVFTSPECADCRDTGVENKPAFWVE